MKRNHFIVILSTIFLVFGIVQTGLSSGYDNVKPSLIYGVYIDNYVKKCECKAWLLDANSLNIRRIATRATVKGAYSKANRTRLVRHLMEVNVPLNPNRIAYHLNQHFARSVNPNAVYTVLLNGTTK